ncbi:MAG: hypothetical protein JWP03_4793 [Phycisphaerales bacterium]|jgi:hypothetical protein|nr:hypothetical protein [Phycisphaerales bacterium]
MSKVLPGIIAPLVFLALCGCAPVARRAELDQRILRTSNSVYPGPDRLYYIGSDGIYDYYVVQWYLEDERGLSAGDQTYKVLRAESVEDPRTQVTTDRSKWRFAGPSKASNDYKIKHPEQPGSAPAS